MSMEVVAVWMAFLAGLDPWPPGVASLKIIRARLTHMASGAVLLLVTGDTR